jgi:hypothetical protein
MRQEPKLCQIDNFSRRYYDKELGAGVGPNPSFEEIFGYTEPFRRFVQNEGNNPQANEIPNQAPSWLPGDDYYTNFHKGDPFTKVPEGYARLPGPGYAALHPGLEDVDPEDYPDIHKMAILADVAPYSRQYNQVSSSFRATKPSRARARPKPFHAPAAPLPGSVTRPGSIQLSRTPKAASTRLGNRPLPGHEKSLFLAPKRQGDLPADFATKSRGNTCFPTEHADFSPCFAVSWPAALRCAARPIHCPAA